jgi:hypothetical protein
LQKNLISIWFFIGALLTVYGALILATGIYEFFSPETDAVVLGNLHIAVWWGAGMLLLGFTFVIRFWPGLRNHG